MDIEGIMLSEIRETAKDKYRVISLVRNPNEQTHKQSKSRIRSINTENKLMVGGGEGKIDGEWERQASSYRRNKSQE